MCQGQSYVSNTHIFTKFLKKNLLNFISNYILSTARHSSNSHELLNDPESHVDTVPESEIIHIETIEYPSALILPKVYGANAKQIMRFTDDRNEITIYPVTKRVEAHFYTGENRTFGIPSDYKSYTVNFDENTKIIPADVDYILQWHNATALFLLDNSNLAVDFMQRIDEMKELRNLEELELSVQRDSYGELFVDRFLFNLPALEYVTLTATQLTHEEFEQFVDKLPLTVGWIQSIHERKVSFEKVHIDDNETFTAKVNRFFANVKRKFQQYFG